MKIDIFAHVLPKKCLDALEKKKLPGRASVLDDVKAVYTLYDMESRFRIMDKFRDLVQVISLSLPPIESVVGPEDAVEIAKMANDEMAELVIKYPDRFVGAIACLPMTNVDAALREADRAINELKFRGVEIFSDINGEPLDSPKFRPLYEKMADYNLPILLHPAKPFTTPDYIGEEGSKYLACSVLAWPYQTTLAMNRLVYSGILEDYPNLIFVAHHCGGILPFLADRIQALFGYNQVIHKGAGFERILQRSPIEYFHRFYGDTVTCGSTPALMCGYSFFGADHLVFGTDMPIDSQLGLRQTRDTIYAIERMEISEADKVKIFEGNTRRLLRLHI